MISVEPLLLALGIAILRPLFAFAIMSLAGPWQIPWLIQIALAVVLALFVMPHIDVAAFTNNPIDVLPMLGGEALIGMAIGLSLQLAIAAARIAGEVVSATIGLSFAQIVDPEHGHSVPIVAQFMGLLAVAVFMAMDGHLVMVRILADSYTTLPPGGTGLTQAALWRVLSRGDAMFAAGFMMALPVVAATLVVQLAMAVAARMAPALNLLAVGMPAMLIGGILMLSLTVPVISDGARSTVSSSFRLAAGVAGDSGPIRRASMQAQLGAPPPRVAVSETVADRGLVPIPIGASRRNAMIALPTASALFDAASETVHDLPEDRVTAIPELDPPLAVATTAIDGLSPVPMIAAADRSDTTGAMPSAAIAVAGGTVDGGGSTGGSGGTAPAAAPAQVLPAVAPIGGAGPAL